MALIALVGAPEAGAAVVVYDNWDNEFYWEIGVSQWGEEWPGTFLDITQPPSQSGERKNGTFGKWWVPNTASQDPAVRFMSGEPGAEVAQTTDLTILDWNGGNNNIAYWTLREYAQSEQVSADARWRFNAPYFYHLPNSSDLSQGTPAISKHAYVGVRTTIAGQWHYGWILFTDLKWPAMWAYETEPNTPIDVPIPAPSAGLMILAAAGVLAPRRSRA